jgi:squalene-hopene/tetraprenyl-beta-curcumene cyclase
MAYSALALKSLNFDNEDPSLRKCLQGLQSFHQLCEGDLQHIPREPSDLDGETRFVHQQCCISPVWDTPWVAVSLIDSGLNPRHPALRRSADWLVKKQITTL